MPTFFRSTPFLHDWRTSTPEQKNRFKAAVKEFVDDLTAGQRFRTSLRVKGVRRAPGVFEMTWAPDGRATFEYGSEVIPGQSHIVWRRIGGHEVFTNP